MSRVKITSEPRRKENTTWQHVCRAVEIFRRVRGGLSEDTHSSHNANYKEKAATGKPGRKHHAHMS